MASKLLSQLPVGDRKHTYRQRDGKESMVAIGRNTQPMPSYYRHTGSGYERLALSSIPNGSLPLYNLADVAEFGGGKSIVMVGDEKMVDMLSLLLREQPVVTWPGDALWMTKADYTPLIGNPLLVIGDTSPESRSATRMLTDYLWVMGVTRIKSIYPPPDGMPGFSGATLSEWLTECMVAGTGPDKARASRLIRTLYDEHSVPYSPSETMEGVAQYFGQAKKGSMREDKSALKNAILTALEKNEHFTILGRSHGSIACQLIKSSELVGFKAEAISRAKLIHLADLDFWRDIFQRDTLSDDDIDELRNGINRVAQSKGMVNLGNLRGRGAIEDGNSIYYHLGNRLLKEDRTTMSLGTMSKDSRFIYMECSPLKWREPEKGWRSHGRMMADALEAFNFKTRKDWLTWIGWMGSALVCGVMPWRVHLWITGDSQAGKSWLMTHTAMRLMGDYVDLSADYSEAAIARLVQSDALPLLLDEGEPGDKAMMKVLSFLKNAAQGDAKRLRSQPGSSSDVFVTTPRATFVLASTKVPPMGQAEASRTEIIRLKAPDKTAWEGINKGLDKALGDGWAAHIRNGIIGSTRAILGKVKEVETRAMAEHHSGSRRAKIIGMLFAGAHALGVSYTDSDLADFAGAEVKGNDNEDLLSSILDMTVEVIDDWGEGGEMTRRITVHEMLAACVSRNARSKMAKSAARHGMRIRGYDELVDPTSKGPPHMVIVPTLNWLRRSLEVQAGVRDIDIGASLRMIDGVSDTRAEFLGHQRRCLMIPDEVLRRIGYQFNTEVRPTDETTKDLG